MLLEKKIFDSTKPNKNGKNCN